MAGAGQGGPVHHAATNTMGPGLAEAISAQIAAAQQGAGPGVAASMQPVVVGIEIGPEMLNSGAGPGPGAAPSNTAPSMQGMISNAIQQALRGGPAGGAPAGAGQPGQPQVQVAVGPPLHLPLGPPPAPPGMGVGNMNAFDPFLPCGSHHLPGGGRGPGQGGRRAARNVRSAPGSAAASRSPSVPRAEPGPARATAAGPGIGDLLHAMVGGQGEAGEADQQMVAMIQV